LDVLLANQDVQVEELAQCDVSVDESSQGRPFEWHGRDLVCLQESQEPEQLRGKAVVVRDVGVEMFTELSQD
jgi:hypothetical protein